MKFHRGRLPVSLFILAFSVGAYAQRDIPLTLAEAEDIALDREPGREALLASASALEEQAVAAGQLPDPQLRVGLANYPIESGGFTTEGMTQGQFGVRQMFPPGRSRAIATRQFNSLAVEKSESAETRTRDVLTSTRHAWLELFYWRQAHDIVMETRPFFTDLVEIARSLYAVGRNTQQDLLRAELELGRLDDRLIEIERRRAQARATLSEWLGADASRPVATRLPTWQRVPSLETLHAAIETHPALRAAEARIRARAAGVDLANQRYKPGWALDLGYGYRDGTLPGGEPRSDFISLSVTVDLPLFRKNRQDRFVAAALSERRAAEHNKNAMLRSLKRELDAEYVRWRDLTRRVALYEERILSLSDDHAQAALLAYQSQAGDFADVMRGYIDVLNTRLEFVRLEVERGQSYAVLANLGGLPR